MIDLQTQIDQLEAAKAKGALRLRIGDEEVQYRSLAEMNAIIAEKRAQLRATGHSQHYPSFVARPR